MFEESKKSINAKTCTLEEVSMKFAKEIGSEVENYNKIRKANILELKVNNTKGRDRAVLVGSITMDVANIPKREIVRVVLYLKDCFILYLLDDLGRPKDGQTLYDFDEVLDLVKNIINGKIDSPINRLL